MAAPAPMPRQFRFVLEKRVEYGGVYADIDTLFVQPFPTEFWESDFVPGREEDVVCPGSGKTHHSWCYALIKARKETALGCVSGWAA
jgi:hypothetical protein